MDDGVTSCAQCKIHYHNPLQDFMYYLFESATGLSLFKEEAKAMQLVSFHQFASMEEAFEQQKSVVSGELTGVMQEFVDANFVRNFKSEKLGVADQHLAQALKDKYEIKAICSEETLNMHRKIQEQLYKLVPKLNKEKEKQYSASLAHNFSRYQVQYNSESIDSMILQSVNILEESEKEINNYVMRLMEWAVWSFPEVSKVIPDAKLYCKVMSIIGGDKTAVQKAEIQKKLEKHLEAKQLEEITNYSHVSVGTEITPEDSRKISQLADVILSLLESKEKIEKYITDRMHKIAPNFSKIVGPLIGAKLLSKAGSLQKLAKYPASTIQILGAEATLFKALKTKQKTPKYGFIYNCSLLNEAAQKEKGKIARKVAQNAAICVRYDTFHEGELEEKISERCLPRCSLTTTSKPKLQKIDKLQAFKQSLTQIVQQKEVVKKGTIVQGAQENPAAKPAKETVKEPAKEIVPQKKAVVTTNPEPEAKKEKSDKPEHKNKEEKKDKSEKHEKKDKEAKPEKEHKEEKKSKEPKEEKKESKPEKEHKSEKKDKEEKKEKSEKHKDKEEKKKDKHEKDKAEKDKHKDKHEKHDKEHKKSKKQE